jgi:hypothetical protein
MTLRKANRERAAALSAYFDKHGWPAAGREIERATKGKVSKLFVARYAAGLGREEVTPIGGGLYAPTLRIGSDPLPVSRDVAAALLAIEPGQLIDDHDHLRLFKVAVIMGRLGRATVKISRTTRNGIRRQTARVTISDKGRALLEARARLAKDEF